MENLKWFNKQSNNVIWGLSCSFIISVLNYFLLQGEIKSMFVISLMSFFSAFGGIVNHKKAWLSALSIWVIIPLMRFIKYTFIAPDSLPQGKYDSFFLFSIVSLALCFLVAYSSVIARWIATRARL